MARRSLLRQEESTDINLSPMIDCIFILLIFFIVTTVFVQEQGVSVNKPDVAATVPLEEEANLTLEITAENAILLDGEQIGLADVAGGVQARLSDPDMPVTLRAHRKSAHGTFVSVWDAARRGGAQALSFTTVN
jgi:biopolymer transport protein ExbD